MNAPNADISGDLLFPVVESLSPRLAWMKKHHCITLKSNVEPNLWLAGFSEELITDPDLRAQWMFIETASNGDSTVGEGETEDEAIAEAAIKFNIHLWNEEAGA